MNEIHTTEELALTARTVEELAQSIYDRVALGDQVRQGGDQLDSTIVLLELIEEDSDRVNAMLSSMSIYTPMGRKYYECLDEKTVEMAEKMAAKYDWSAEL